MKKPFTDLTGLLTDKNYRLSEHKQRLLKTVIDAIGAENVSGAKGRGRDKLTVYTFSPVNDLPEIKKVRFRQDFYSQPMETYITVHQHLIEDATGDVVDAVYYCGDYCHQDHRAFVAKSFTNNDYGGWNGCNEVMAPQWCANCGDQIK